MADRTVSDLMTRDVVTVAPEASFKSVARLLLERRVDAAPVVDADGRVRGVVSAADLTCHAEEPPSLPALLLGRDRREHARKRRGRTAEQLMSSPVTCVPPDAGVCAALELMNKAHVGRVLVVEQEDRLIGILTRSDVLRDYLRSDDDLRRDVERAAHAAVGDCPVRLDVEVHDGVVLLCGWVERTSCAWAMAAAAREVPGVVDVDEDVLSDIDDTVVHEMALRGPWP